MIDAIVLAGGIIKDANTRYINLSKHLTDEMVIVVYFNKEVEDMLAKENVEALPCICEVIKNDACIENTKEESDNTSTNVSKLINVNSASLSELITLSGIGEVKAKAIIAYREENGLFLNIEDLMKVNGISESTYSKIKDSITIE